MPTHGLWVVVATQESQGTRTFGALPEFVYSLAGDPSDPAVYVNLFVPSTFTTPTGTLAQNTSCPFGGDVSVTLVETRASSSSVHPGTC
eukprot:m.398235 g.398235  ORF g.398235 m.398235 type:complete len:89 (+) comp21135_c2_seq4:1866-2132(+)